MKAQINRQVRLKYRPIGIPEAEHFEIVEAPVPDLAEGQVLVRNIYLSVDPAMCGWVNADANYLDPVPVGAVMRSFAVGRIVESLNPLYRRGEVITGLFRWQDYAAVSVNTIDRKVTERDPSIFTSLGVLGLNGFTAYFGMFEIGKPRQNETVVVSAAAGAVGSCAGQIAKMQGCRSVGIAVGPRKVGICLGEFGYDAAIDYEAEDIDLSLRAACPNGIDIYFDLTCGPISDAVLKQLNVNAPMIVCGTIAIPNWDPIPLGPRVARYLLVKRARIEGFLCTDYSNRYPKALKALSQWIRKGLIHYREEVLVGIEQAPGSIAGLYRGENLGKRLIRIADESIEMP